MKTAVAVTCLVVAATLLGGCTGDDGPTGVIGPDDPPLPTDRFAGADATATPSDALESTPPDDPCPRDANRYAWRFGPAQTAATQLVGGQNMDRIRGDAMARLDLDTGLWSRQPGPPGASDGPITVTADWVVVAGGRSEPERGVDVLDRRTGAWTSGPDLPLGRVHHATAIINDTVYLFGGERYPDGPPLATAWTWRIGDESWRDAPDMPAGLSRAGVVVVGDDIWLLGGRTADAEATRAMWVHDPARGTWNPTGGLPAPRASPAVALHCDALWLVGGHNGTAPSNTTHRMDLVSRVWRAGPNAAIPRVGGSIAGHCNTLWLTGGNAANGTAASLELLAAPGAAACTADLARDGFQVARAGKATGNTTGGGRDGDVVVDAPPRVQLDANLLTGRVPLRVTFTLTGSDPEGADVAWRLNLTQSGITHRKGTSLPATVQWTFWNDGNHNITLTGSDGNHTGNATLTIKALPGEGHLQAERISLIGADPAACIGARVPDADGFSHQVWAINPASRGAIFSIDVSGFPPSPDIGITFLNSKGETAGRFFTHPLADWERIDGTVPLTAERAYVYSCAVPAVVSGWYRAG